VTQFACGCWLGESRPDEVHLTDLARLRDESASAARHSHGRFAAVCGAGRNSRRSLIVTRDHISAVGDVRLDNRSSVARGSGIADNAQTDLELVVAGYLAIGRALIPTLQGDFAFVLWDERTSEAMAVRDAIGVKRLFYEAAADFVRFSSSLSSLATARKVNQEFVASYLVGGLRKDAGSTIWTGYRSVPPGSYEIWSPVRHERIRYWSADVAQSSVPAHPREQCQAFLGHLDDAVRLRLNGVQSAWSELSGGLDSASVLAVSERLYRDGKIEQRVAGTYSFVDEMAGADELPFLRSLKKQFAIPNVPIANSFPWENDGVPPPLTDEPRIYYPFWARDRRADAMVRNAGATVVLSGGGSDYYLTGTPHFLADMLRAVRLREAFAQAHRLASNARGSAWKTLWKYGITPLLPRTVRNWSHASSSVPAWIEPRFAMQYGVRERISSAFPVGGSNRSRFLAATLFQLDAAPDLFELPLSAESTEKRYPFFHRPLVEFSLSLPRDMTFRDGTTKWILREAGRGLVPDEVRMRKSKGWIDGRTCWALSHRYQLLSKLLKDPLVVQAGWVQLEPLRAAFENARFGLGGGVAPLMRTLSLETWLAVQHHVWPEAASEHAATGMTRPCELATT